MWIKKTLYNVLGEIINLGSSYGSEKSDKSSTLIDTIIKEVFSFYNNVPTFSRHLLRSFIMY